MRYVLFENKRGYIDSRECESVGEILDVYALYSDGSAVKGFAVYGGERFRLDEYGRVRLPFSAIKDGKNKVMFYDKEALYECEDFIKLAGLVFPSLPKETEELIFLLSENEKYSKRLREIERYIDASAYTKNP